MRCARERDCERESIESEKREGGERGRKGREGGREGEREGGMERGREGGSSREGGSEGGMDGGRDEGRKIGGREGPCLSVQAGERGRVLFAGTLEAQRRTRTRACAPG